MTYIQVNALCGYFAATESHETGRPQPTQTDAFTSRKVKYLRDSRLSLSLLNSTTNS